METAVIKMVFTKSTKGTHVYGDSNSDPPVPTLYIKKTALPAKPPAEIEVTIAFEAEGSNSEKT